MTIIEIMEREVNEATRAEFVRREDAKARALKMRQEREDRIIGRVASVVVIISAVVTAAVVIYKVIN